MMTVMTRVAFSQGAGANLVFDRDCRQAEMLRGVDEGYPRVVIPAGRGARLCAQTLPAISP